jgi:hypothetical protein
MPKGKIHDFRKGKDRHGHRITRMGQVKKVGRDLIATILEGFAQNVAVGDHFILPGNPNPGVMVATDIHHYRDPEDRFAARLRFLGELEPHEIRLLDETGDYRESQPAPTPSA